MARHSDSRRDLDVHADDDTDDIVARFVAFLDDVPDGDRFCALDCDVCYIGSLAQCHHRIRRSASLGDSTKQDV